MIVELCTAFNGDLVYVNTDHIVTVRIKYGTPEGKNEITIVLTNGESHTVLEDALPDGYLGPDGLRVMAKIAPSEFTERFLRVQTLRAKQVLEASPEA